MTSVETLESSAGAVVRSAVMATVEQQISDAQLSAEDAASLRATVTPMVHALVTALVTEFFRSVGDLIDASSERSRRYRDLAKSATHALRAMKADLMAEEIENMLEVIDRTRTGSL